MSFHPNTHNPRFTEMHNAPQNRDHKENPFQKQKLGSLGEYFVNIFERIRGFEKTQRVGRRGKCPYQKTTITKRKKGEADKNTLEANRARMKDVCPTWAKVTFHCTKKGINALSQEKTESISVQTLFTKSEIQCHGNRVLVYR